MRKTEDSRHITRRKHSTRDTRHTPQTHGKRDTAVVSVILFAETEKGATKEGLETSTTPKKYI